MFLVLHGQTEWNRDGRLQGRGDSALTADGVRQVARSAAILRVHLAGPARIVASPLGRTRATAQLLADALGVRDVATDDRLKELHMGAWEGLTRLDIEQGWPTRAAMGGKSGWFFHAPDGETYAALAARVSGWLAEQHAHDDLIVVSHGLTGRVLRGLYAGLSPEESFALEVARDAPFHLAGGRIAKLALA